MIKEIKDKEASNKVVTLNTDVRKLTENKWSVNGDTARAIIAAKENCKVVRKQAEEACHDAHIQLWDIINKLLGTGDKDSLSLDTSHEDAGLLFIVRKERGENKGATIQRVDGNSVLSAILSAIVDD